LLVLNKASWNSSCTRIPSDEREDAIAAVEEDRMERCALPCG
jgi:hypothetical protein